MILDKASRRAEAELRRLERLLADARVGAASAVVLALRAARVDPIVALREE